MLIIAPSLDPSPFSRLLQGTRITMGWFSSSSSSSASSAAEQQQQQLPTRSARQACWTGRDAYFGCLTRNNLIIPPGTDVSSNAPGGASGSGGGARNKKPSSTEVTDKGSPQQQPTGMLTREQDPCAKERDEYEKHCASSWVDYFNKRRVLEERQRRMLEASGASADQKPAGRVVA